TPFVKCIRRIGKKQSSDSDYKNKSGKFHRESTRFCVVLMSCYYRVVLLSVFSDLSDLAYRNSGIFFSASFVAPGRINLSLSCLIRLRGPATSCSPIPRNPPAPTTTKDAELVREKITSFTSPIFSLLSLYTALPI